MLSLQHSQMWRRYLAALDTHPILTKSLTSATLFVSGDALAQRLDGTITRSGYDTTRGRTALVWGGILFAPVAHVWYNRILNPLFPGSSTSAVMKKVITDQIVWAPAANVAYLTASNMLSGKSYDQSVSIMKSAMPSVMVANYAVWPLAQAVNFRFVPPPLQLPFINLVILGWSCFLAVKANDSNENANASGSEMMKKQQITEKGSSSK